MAHRNANGEGTIYPRKDGRYEGAVYVQTVSGRRKRIRVYGATRNEAHEKLTKAKSSSQAGVLVPDRAWRLGEYLDYWLENVVRPNNRPSTYVLYESAVRINLKPALATVRLDRLPVSTTQAFLNNLLESGCSIRKVDSVREILSSALGCACREELIIRNVASLVRLPKHQKGDVIPWSTHEARKFLVRVRGDRLYPAFTLSMLYGMRRGEVLGLRWEDVDFERGVIRIRQQLQRVFGELRESPLKTDAGRRDVPLLSTVRHALLKERHEQGVATGLVFTTKNGTPIDPKNHSRMFKLLCQKYEVRQIKLHHVRHTTATLLKDLGIPDRDIQLILGHSHVSTTQQIYQHASMESRTAALEKMERLFMRTVDSLRCRQKLPSGLPIIERLTTSIFGTPGKIRTCDPLVRSHPKPQIEDRFTAVKSAFDDSRYVWLLGAVAVSTAVKSALFARPSESSQRRQGLPDPEGKR